MDENLGGLISLEGVRGQYATTSKMKIVQWERDTIGILSVEDAAVSMAASDGLVWRSQCKL